MICQNDVPKYSPNLLKLEPDEWNVDIIFYLKNLTCPAHLVGHKKRALRLKSSKYVISKDGLGWRNLDGIILWCVDEGKDYAFKMWESLCNLYQSPNQNRKMILRDKFRSIQMLDSESVTSFLGIFIIYTDLR
jgi:hypothetical protein